MQQGTADALNELTGRSLHRRDWGRALEALKREHGLGNGHHGRILDTGVYADLDGNVIDDLESYL